MEPDTISIIGLYAPANNAVHEGFFQEVEKELAPISNRIIIAGDLNALLNEQDQGTA